MVFYVHCSLIVCYRNSVHPVIIEDIIGLLHPLLAPPFYLSEKFDRVRLIECVTY